MVFDKHLSFFRIEFYTYIYIYIYIYIYYTFSLFQHNVAKVLIYYTFYLEYAALIKWYEDITYNSYASLWVQVLRRLYLNPRNFNK